MKAEAKGLHFPWRRPGGTSERTVITRLVDRKYSAGRLSVGHGLSVLAACLQRPALGDFGGGFPLYSGSPRMPVYPMNLSDDTSKNLENLSAVILLIGLRPFSMSNTF